MSVDVARLFDAMADGYDELEPWYRHLYATLHEILTRELARPPGAPRGRALDAGCGTGFQTARLQALGYESHGVDLSPGLLAVARRKLPSARLALGRLEALPYPDAQFDVVSSCGSTLSLVEDPTEALSELARVLRPSGLLLLECEHRWSLDLAWALLSSLTFDALGYGLTPAEAWRQLTRRRGTGQWTRYPCPMADGTTEYMRLRLFTTRELLTMLRAVGLTPQRVWGIHVVTNLIPSTILHRDRLGRVGAGIFRMLSAVDRTLASRAAGHWLANSVVVLSQKAI